MTTHLMGALPIAGYYAILDVRPAPDGDLAPGQLERELARADELLAAGPCCLQVRGKHVADRALLGLLRAVRPRTRQAGVALVCNDRPDLGFLAEADVIHVGQADLPVPALRAVQDSLGRRTFLGVSTHNLQQALAAVAAGADYIGFGPVFATSSKDRPDPTVGLAGLRAVVAEVRVPVVAIGGITRAAIGAVAATGAAAAAVIADIDNSGDRTAAGRLIGAAFGRAQHA